MRRFWRKRDAGTVISQKRVVYSYRQYQAAYEQLADELPWFGEEPFRPSRPGPVPRPACSDLGFVRRVYISLLIGGSRAHVARRAGCSPRLVLSLLREVIYVPVESLTDIFRSWVELGLLAPVDGPEYGLVRSWRDEDEFDRRGKVSPDRLPVFCLVCHRIVGGAVSEQRFFDGSRIESSDPSFQVLDPLVASDTPGSLDQMQAHLINHFMLGSDPIPVGRGQEPWEHELRHARDGRIKGKRARSIIARASLRKRMRWWDVISPMTMHLLSEMTDRSKAESVVPMSQGKSLTRAQAVKHWTKFLE